MEGELTSFLSSKALLSSPDLSSDSLPPLLFNILSREGDYQSFMQSQAVYAFDFETEDEVMSDKRSGDLGRLIKIDLFGSCAYLGRTSGGFVVLPVAFGQSSAL